ncbi:MAG: DUF6049 family protein [Leucobacter sp.]
MPSPIPLRRICVPVLASIISVGLAVMGAQSSIPMGSQDHSRVFHGVDDAEAESIEELPALTVASSAPVLDVDEGDFEFTVLLENPTDEPLPTGTIELELFQDPAANMEELNTETSSRGLVFATQEVGETPAGEDQDFTMSVPAAEMPLTEFSDRGVYRVRAVLMPEDTSDTRLESPAEERATDADPSDIAGSGDPAPQADDGNALLELQAESLPEGALLRGLTPIVWRGAELGARVQVTTIVPLVLPEVVHSLPTRGQLSEVIPRLDELLTAAESTNSTLAVDPRLIAGIRAYGDAAPAEAIEWLDRLRTTPLPQFVLQFADADPAAQAALGFDELLQPREISFVTRFGEFPETPDSELDDIGGTSDDAVGDSPDDTADDPIDDDAKSETTTSDDDPSTDSPDQNTDEPLERPTPTLDELLAWPAADYPAAWPAGGEVDSATVELLRDGGIDSMVLESINVNYAGGPQVQVSGMSTLVADTAVGYAIREGIGAETQTERAAGLSAAAAQLALAAQNESPGVAIALDRGAMAEAEDPEAILTQLSELTWIDHVGEGDQTEGSGSLRAGSTLETRRELLRTAVGRESTVTELAPVLAHPEYLTGYQRARLLQLFATRYAPPDADFESVSERFLERDSELLNGVSVISTEQTQLVGTSSRVPLQVRNALPFNAVVTGEVVPASAALRVPEQTIEVTEVPAEGNETVLVPVLTRVSAGESGLIVSLTDITKEHTYYTGTLPITIRSAFERIALWTVGGLALLLLGLGTWRSFRRKAAKSARD